MYVAFNSALDFAKLLVVSRSKLLEIYTGWWLGHPSEKYESIEMILPNIWKNKKCSKPPTRNGWEIPFVAPTGSPFHSE